MALRQLVASHVMWSPPAWESNCFAEQHWRHSQEQGSRGKRKRVGNKQGSAENKVWWRACRPGVGQTREAPLAGGRGSLPMQPRTNITRRAGRRRNRPPFRVISHQRHATAIGPIGCATPARFQWALGQHDRRGGMCGAAAACNAHGAADTHGGVGGDGGEPAMPHAAASAGPAGAQPRTQPQRHRPAGFPAAAGGPMGHGDAATPGGRVINRRGGAWPAPGVASVMGGRGERLARWA